MTPCPKCNWPHHSPIPITLTCVKCGASVDVGSPAHTPKPKPKQRPPAGQQTRLIRWLQFFILPTDRGIGDTVERLLAKAGGRKIKAQLEKLSIPCGCTNRQKWLNDRYPNPNFSG